MYTHNKNHRNGNPRKSQWSISKDEEKLCFDCSKNNQWLNEFDGWGLHCPQGDILWLGWTQGGGKQTFIAKFVCAKGNKPNWHGYPANHQKHVHDIPDTHILNKWLQEKLIKPAKIRKIAKGQTCTL